MIESRLRQAAAYIKKDKYRARDNPWTFTHGSDQQVFDGMDVFGGVFEECLRWTREGNEKFPCTECFSALYRHG